MQANGQELKLYNEWLETFRAVKPRAAQVRPPGIVLVFYLTVYG